MKLLLGLTDRSFVLATAIIGAMMATAGAALGSKGSGQAVRFGRVLLWTGYSVSLASVALFIVAGFLLGPRP